MTTGRDVVLISADLMFASRLDAAMRPSGVRVTRVPTGWPPVAARAVFIDLNADVEARMLVIARVRADHADVPIIAFCGHEEKERRRAAMAAGATQVVTNGGVQGAALRLIGAGAQ